MEKISKETHEWACNVLLDAYRNETLKAGDCSACAVGNLLKAKGAEESGYWSLSLYFDFGVINNKYRGYDQGKEQLKILPFSENQVFKIEQAFESGVPTKIEVRSLTKRLVPIFKDNSKSGQYKGLKAVMDLLNSWVDENYKDPIQELNTIAESYSVNLQTV